MAGRIDAIDMQRTKTGCRRRREGEGGEYAQTREI
jgi:hypothetical protein